MNSAKKYLVAVALAGTIVSALPALAFASGNGGSVSGNGVANNGGAKAGNGGNGANGGNGGSVIATGSENNGGAAAGTGGAGGSVESTGTRIRVLDLGALRSRFNAR